MLGATDPNVAVAGSARRTIFEEWEKLGLPGQPNTGNNGVHASASPFEGLAERVNWLGQVRVLNVLNHLIFFVAMVDHGRAYRHCM